MTDVQIVSAARDLTEQEVAFYHEHGWVKVDRLVEPEFAAQLYRAACASVDAGEVKRGENEGFFWATSELAVAGVEPFRSFLLSDAMGRNAQRLIDRTRLTEAEVPVVYRGDVLMHKYPHSKGIGYHQDSCEHGSDRVGEMQWWLALEDVTPEMGSMRFIDRSQREGPLGTSGGAGDTLERYPKLPELLGLSPLLHYQAGDATIHQGYTVHGSPPNETERARIHLLFSYAPADTRYWNGDVDNHGSERVTLSDVEKYPVIEPAC